MNLICSNPWCKRPFTCSQGDRQFLEQIQPTFGGRSFPLPLPTRCPLCRMQQRLAYRNERFLYHRKCDLTGKQMISAFSVDKPFPVYDNDVWWEDSWSALSYGRAVDFGKPFFEQFFALRNAVPRMARQQQKPMENSDYCNCASKNKNCYLVFSTNECEDCYYGSWVNQSRDCVDCLNIEKCELCYDCTGCRDCYGARTCLDCINCHDVFFLRDCHDCSDCFGCSNQINKRFMVFNQQKSEAEFRDFLAQVQIGDHRQMEKAQEQISTLLHDHIVKEFHGANVELCSGDYLKNCKALTECYECDHCEEMAYCQCIQNSRHCMDQTHWGQHCEWVYNSQACGYDDSHLICCNLCWGACSDLLYCDQCTASKNCLGCVGLKHQQYCIFNTQYTKEEYEALAMRVVAHMQSTGEWGNFFPPSQALYAYNETLSQEQVPLTKEQALERGFSWKDDAGQQQDRYMGPHITIPDDISDVEDSIVEQILVCEQTGRPYKIIPQELKFYRAQSIPVPHLCPDERHRRRLQLRNPRILFDRTCGKCGKGIRTTYQPSRPEIVYCEKCYLQTVR